VPFMGSAGVPLGDAAAPDRNAISTRRGAGLRGRRRPGMPVRSRARGRGTGHLALAFAVTPPS
jgi:hypothetical protein